MNAERKAMTLERLEPLIYWLDMKYKRHGEEEDRDAANALRELAAHLSRAADPVGYVSADHLTELENGDALNIRLWRSSDDFVGPIFELFTHPPEPARDAKDAARYRWMRVHVFDEKDWGQGECDTPEQVDSAIDAAMQANPDAK